MRPRWLRKKVEVEVTGGVRGERGPTGDHGQHGDTGDIGLRGPAGPAGPKGEPGKRGLFGRHVTLSFWALVAVFTVVLVGFGIAVAQVQQVSHRTGALARQNRTIARRADETAKEAKRLAIEGKQAHDAVCAYRAGLAHDVDQGNHYLNDRDPHTHRLLHPGSILGLSRPSLLHNLDVQTKRLESLHGLHCSYLTG